MTNNYIQGGYVLQPRCIDHSWISTASPVTREIWSYLVRKANHDDVRKGGYVYKRGEVFTSYSQIRKDLAWKVGYRTKMYSESQTKHTMNALRMHGMIDTARELGGVRVSIVKYNYYQDPKNYGGTNDGTNEGANDELMPNQSRPYNKNDKNEKNEKKYILRDEDVSSLSADAKQEYGSKYINELIAYLKTQSRLPALDDTIKNNRRYGHFLLVKYKNKDETSYDEALKRIKMLIDYASQDTFWRSRTTSLVKLHKYSVTIYAQMEEKHAGKRISS